MSNMVPQDINHRIRIVLCQLLHHIIVTSLVITSHSQHQDYHALGFSQKNFT
jgi:hypothetical protein